MSVWMLWVKSLSRDKLQFQTIESKDWLAIAPSEWAAGGGEGGRRPSSQWRLLINDLDLIQFPSIENNLPFVSNLNITRMSQCADLWHINPSSSYLLCRRRALGSAGRGAGLAPALSGRRWRRCWDGPTQTSVSPVWWPRSWSCRADSSDDWPSWTSLAREIAITKEMGLKFSSHCAGYSLSSYAIHSNYNKTPRVSLEDNWHRHSHSSPQTKFSHFGIFLWRFWLTTLSTMQVTSLTSQF